MPESYVECPKCEFLAVKGCKFCPNCGEAMNTTPVAHTYQHPVSAWFAALGLKPSQVVATVSFLLIAGAFAFGVFWLVVSPLFPKHPDPPDTALQDDYAAAAKRIPNLRYFPGWDRWDTYTLRFNKCTLLGVKFSVESTDYTEATIRIYNHTGASTDPHLELTVYDRDGNPITSCTPARYLWSDFSSGETADKSDSFYINRAAVFYNVGEHQ